MNLGLKRFTLWYLLLEVAWIAIALGTLRFCWVYPRSGGFDICFYLSEIACCGATGAMLGGFFGRMVLGAIVALVVPVCIVIFLFGNYVIYLIEGPAS